MVYRNLFSYVSNGFWILSIQERLWYTETFYPMYQAVLNSL